MVWALWEESVAATGKLRRLLIWFLLAVVVLCSCGKKRPEGASGASRHGGSSTAQPKKQRGGELQRPRRQNLRDFYRQQRQILDRLEKMEKRRRK